MLNGRSLHKKSTFSLSSTDFDVEGAALDGDDYDAGLSLPLIGSGPTHGPAWSAKGPAAYKPTLTPLASAREHLQWARAGWRDANRWLEAAKLVAGSAEVRNSLLKGFLLTSSVVGGIYFLELTMVPTHIFFQNQHTDVTTTSLENVFVVYPLIAAAYWLASLWTADVAKAAYTARHGRTVSALPSLPAGTSRRFLQESYRIILVINYLAICYALQKLPLLGRPFAFFFMSFIDGYYIFETIWVARGWTLERRMRYAECRWSYFVAFGLPSTLISFFHPSGLLNVALFMLIFPFCTVLALLSSPQPRNPTPSEPWLARIPFFVVTVRLHRALLRAFPGPANRGPIYPVPGAVGANAGYGRLGAGMGGHGGVAAYGYGSGAAGGAGIGGGMMGAGGSGYAGAVGGGGGSGFDGSSLGRRTAAQMVGGAWGASNLSSSPRLDATTPGPFGARRPSGMGLGANQQGGAAGGGGGGGQGGGVPAPLNGGMTSTSGIASPHASAAVQSPVRATSAAAASQSAASGATGNGAALGPPPMGPARFGRTNTAEKGAKKD
ncbi:hypothetical protein OC846_002858 [Tilletia horrida]|uniref:Uncharacterized protein n=1 Tax=Tilletia horrida TaxID=155126 RepID=A0AAN6JUI0_9BASI|nr:hypothetical protein OC846_002858 [Tilletia horrida]KAK0568639.1 hypothetical protein OC861_001716 [Tilletia horrida]